MKNLGFLFPSFTLSRKKSLLLKISSSSSFFAITGCSDNTGSWKLESRTAKNRFQSTFFSSIFPQEYKVYIYLFLFNISSRIQGIFIYLPFFASISPQEYKVYLYIYLFLFNISSRIQGINYISTFFSLIFLKTARIQDRNLLFSFLYFLKKTEILFFITISIINETNK